MEVISRRAVGWNMMTLYISNQMFGRFEANFWKHYSNLFQLHYNCYMNILNRIRKDHLIQWNMFMS